MKKPIKFILLALLSLGLTQPVLAQDKDIDVLGEFLDQHFNEPKMALPQLSASSAIVINSKTGEVLYQKNTETVRPIASISKLITAITILDSGVPLDEKITISEEEIDRRSGANGRNSLPVGTVLTRKELLHLALMNSENRAAHALARSYPGGKEAFIARMNRTVRGLGMRNSVFYDPTGLDSRNVSTASDLALAVKEAYTRYPLIRQFSTSTGKQVTAPDGKIREYRNTNMLVREGKWKIDMQKTGFINKAGYCLVMHAQVDEKPLIIVLLKSSSSVVRANDARTIKSWVEDKPQTWL